MNSPCGPAALAALALATAAGCGGRLDAARALEEGRPAVRIPYRGTGADARRWPDYGAIDASVLAPEADAFTALPPPQPDAPRAPAKAPPKKGVRR
jgi:hypothetical protein